VILDRKTRRVVGVAFAPGKVHDFTPLKRSDARMIPEILFLGDGGFQGVQKLHPNSRTPKKKSKHHSLTREEKAANRELARQRILAEHVIRRLKVFRILSERYRNRRKRYGLRFTLIAALYNLEYAS